MSTFKRLHALASQATPVWMVGPLDVSKRVLVGLWTKIDSRPIKALAAPLGVAACGAATIAPVMEMLLDGMSIGGVGKTAFNLLGLAGWGSMWIHTGQNTSFTQFRFFERRKRQKALRLCRAGDVEGLQKLQFPHWDWTIFESWSKAKKDDLPLSPMTVAFQSEQWEVVRWLITQKATLAHPMGTSLIHEIFHEAAAHHFHPNYVGTPKTNWDRLVYNAPKDIFVQAIEALDLREQNLDGINSEIFITMNLFRRGVHLKSTQDPLELFRMLRHHFSDHYLDNVIRERQMDSSMVKRHHLELLDQVMDEMYQGFASIREHERLKEALPDVVSKAPSAKKHL